MVLSRFISEIFNVEKYCDLKIQVKGQSRSLKVLSFDRLCMYGFLLVSYSNFVLLDIRIYSDLENRVRGHSRSSESTHIDPPPM